MQTSSEQTSVHASALPRAPSPTSSRRLSWLFWILVVLLLPLMLRASLDFGATWDEADRHLNGQAIVEYYEGLRTREEAHYGTMYPGLFDVIPAYLETRLHVDRYILRHRVNAVFGWVGIVFTGLLAGRLFGSWSAILAVILLALSPRYFAHSMNNPKDLPFAAMSAVALYYMSRLSPRWPYISAGAGAKLAVALALALATRPSGLLYFAYVPCLIVALVVASRTTAAGETLVINRRVEWWSAVELAARVALVLVAGLLLSTVVWPWAQADPFTRPFNALARASQYDWDGGFIFRGVEYAAANVPWSYLPTWFLISTPPVVLAGMVLSIVPHVRGWGFARVALWIVAVLPIALVILHHSMVYDGIRHVLFAYIPMVMLAASGWAGLLARGQRWLRVGGVALLVAALANVLAFDVRSYPNLAVYVNELAGGPKDAFGRYELDYWGNCVLQAVTWSAGEARRGMMPVAVWGRPEHLISADAARFHELIAQPNQNEPHHLEIRLLRGSIKEIKELAGRTDVLYRVTTADGAVLCAVFPGPDFDELHRRIQAFSRPSS
jgi:hypothetical protein